MDCSFGRQIVSSLTCPAIDVRSVVVPVRARMPLGGTVILVVLLSVQIFCFNLSTLRADYRESFESAETSWKLADADCQLRLSAHQRTYEVCHTGRGCETVQLVAGQGTLAYLTHTIPAGRVIAEWNAALWIKSDRPGLQILARVVLPRATDPQSGGPLSTLLRGDIYQRVGSWQRVAVQGADVLLERQVRVLRSQYGTGVDAREAYIDMIAINAYGGTGVTQLWIDDLEVQGHVPAGLSPVKNDLRALPAAYNTPLPPTGNMTSGTMPTARRDPPVQLSGSNLVAEGRPIFPRVIQYQGEALEWLQSLGFNVVQLPAPPTAVQLREAARLGIWLVAPPPPDGFVTPAHDRVLAWHLGSGLTAAQLPLTRQRVTQTRRFDPHPQRPTVAECSESLESYSRIASLLIFGQRPLGSSLSLPGYADWLAQRPALTRPGTPFWAAIQTEPASEVVDQWSAFELGLPAAGSLEPEQIRLLVYQAITAGARGLVFTSRESLDISDRDAENRLRVLDLINRELEVIEPWLSAGARSTTVDSGVPHVQVSILQTERAQLVMVLDESPNQQFTSGVARTGSLSLVVPSIATAPHVHLLSVGGLQTLPHRRVAGGIRITLDDAATISLIAITQDPLVLNHLVRTLNRHRAGMARAQYELAAAQVDLVEQVHARLRGPAQGNGVAERGIVQARDNLRHCELLLGSSDYRGSQTYADKTMNALSQTRRTYWAHAAADFPAPIASPFCVSFASLPLHWELARRLQASPQWSVNRLPAGDFEDLGHLRATGWQNLSQNTSVLRSDVELLPQAAHSGGFGLALRVNAVDPRTPPATLEGAVTQVVTASVLVHGGQLVRVHGRVHVPVPLAGHGEGLLIYDSLGRRALAERIHETNGWREFVFYRATPADHDFTVTIALSDLGQVYIDELTISTHEWLASPDITESFNQAGRPARYEPAYSR